MVFYKKMGHTAVGYSPNDSIYTPPEIFERLGLEFDIDVCAPEQALPWIPAKKHFWLEIDGLAQDWEGLVWCNPPYSKPRPWIEKFMAHSNGVMLTSMARSKGSQIYWSKADGLSYLPSNFKFVKPDGSLHGIFLPVMLVAMGEQAVEALKRANYSRVR
jgi:hypothetical protein